MEGIFNVISKEELTEISEKLQILRKWFFDFTIIYEVPGDYSYITQNQGMFSIINLELEDIERLRHSSNVYLGRDGRVSFSCLNHQNLDSFLQALSTLLNSKKKGINSISIGVTKRR